MLNKVKTASEITAIKESGKMLSTILTSLSSKVEASMTTKDLAVIADRELKQLGGTAPFLGYQGFPDVICISLNDEVVHGIPKADKIIHQEDVLSLDFGVAYRGMITDAAISLVVGKTTNQKKLDLIKYTKMSLDNGIAVVRDGIRTGDIGAAVEKTLIKYNLGIVRDLVGHGVGHNLHEDPNIPNYGRVGRGYLLKAGMTIAIEPMATLGSERVYIAPDHWTVLSYDHSLSAHFEHSILILEDGFEVLT